MDFDELMFLKIRLASFKTTIQSASEKTKSSHATLAISDAFFDLVAAIRKAAPALTDHLPEKPKPMGHFHQMGVSAANYIDLEIYAEQLMTMLEYMLKNREISCSKQ